MYIIRTEFDMNFFIFFPRYAIAYVSRRDDGFPYDYSVTLHDLGLQNESGYKIYVCTPPYYIISTCNYLRNALDIRTRKFKIWKNFQDSKFYLAIKKSNFLRHYFSFR